MTAKKTTNPSQNKSIVLVGGNVASNRGGPIDWRSSIRVMQLKRVDTTFNMDVEINRELDQFEKYVQAATRQNISLKDGIVEEGLLMLFKNDAGYQSWIKEQAKKREANGNSENEEDDFTVLENLGKPVDKNGAAAVN